MCKNTAFDSKDLPWSRVDERLFCSWKLKVNLPCIMHPANLSHLVTPWILSLSALKLSLNGLGSGDKEQKALGKVVWGRFSPLLRDSFYLWCLKEMFKFRRQAYITCFHALFYQLKRGKGRTFKSTWSLETFVY